MHYYSLRRLNVVYLAFVAPLAQLAEQSPFKSWVVGSSPTGGTFLYLNLSYRMSPIKINLPKHWRLDRLRQY